MKYTYMMHADKWLTTKHIIRINNKNRNESDFELSPVHLSVWCLAEAEEEIFKWIRTAHNHVEVQQWKNNKLDYTLFDRMRGKIKLKFQIS